MMSIEEWPMLEFPALKPSILARFSTKAGESVCEALIKEIVENVDRPSHISSKILIENDSELEWIMQFINHALGLPFYTDSTYRTLSSAVRIYLAWMTALTSEPHKCCPESLRAYPDRYFRKMMDAFRNIFIPKTLPSLSDMETELCRQGNEIRTILTAIRHLTSAVLDDYKDEVWSRSLLFLMSVIDQLLSQTRTKDEIGCLMSGDLSHALFDCWLKAALSEYIPSPSYWRTLSALTWKWMPHVQIVEWWGRKLLQTTVFIVQDLFGNGYSNIPISDIHLADAVCLQPNKDVIKNVWLDMFQLIGDPAQCFRNSEMLLESLPLDASNLSYFNGRASLSFFLSIVTFSKIIDIFYGNSSVSIDFHECDELQAQWTDALSSSHDERNHVAPSASHRSSNLSSSAIVVLETMQMLTSENNENQHHKSVHSLNQNFSNISTNVFEAQSNRKSLVNFGLLHEQQNSSSTNSAGLSNRHGADRLNHNQHSTDMISSHPSAGQLVWYILRTNHLQVLSTGGLEKAPSSVAMLNIFLGWLFEAAIIPAPPRHNTYSEDFVNQKSLSVDAGFTNVATDHSHSQTSSQFQHLSSGSGALEGAQPSPSVGGGSSGVLAAQMYSRSGTQDEAVGVPPNNMLIDPVTRRSFAAQSTASSSDISSANVMPLATPNYTGSNSTVFEYPSVDGVIAGRAAALGSLCRIVCAKSSEEKLTDEQLAHFYLVLHEALVERDRLILCSLLYYSIDLFKLGLRGVEILLPNYLAALDIILTESIKLRLHPSIKQNEMRNACLRALSSVIMWPTVFGNKKIFGTETNDHGSRRNRSQKNASINDLEQNLTYLDLRQRMLRILLHVLRNEVDSCNLHLALGMCYVFCLHNAFYDISKDDEAREGPMNSSHSSDGLLRAQSELEDKYEEESGKSFAISALRGVVSAVCDNLCKQQWTNDLVTCLAALDCLNSLATLPYSILFHNGDLSTGSLIVTSLCRFVDTQLQKPPMFHSRDLHSSIVLAYFTLANWISSAPMLTEIESCLFTLAQIIEFGMTGGKGLEPINYKPASQRVCDAADYLLNTLFNLNNCLSKTKTPKSLLLDDEFRLLHKFGNENIEMNKFKYFLLGESSIIAFHEAQQIYQISKGLPTVLAVIRTPFQSVHTVYFKLRPKATLNDDLSSINTSIGGSSTESCGAVENSQSPSTFSIASSVATNSSQSHQNNIDQTQNYSSKPSDLADGNFGNAEPIKQFVFPTEINDIHCKLDAESRSLEPISEVQKIREKLSKIRLKLEQGSTGSKSRDERNVWIQSSLGTVLSQPAKPEDAMKKCDSLRVFLYDMGFLNRTAFGKDLIPLNLSANGGNFLEKLSSTIDRTPVRITETVSIFYVRSGQRMADEIIQNCEVLENTSALFCGFLNSLGKGIDLRNGFPHWTGSWKTAFSKQDTLLQKHVDDRSDNFTLDGTKHFLYFNSDQIEIAFITPTRSIRKSASSCPPVPSRLPTHSNSSKLTEKSISKLHVNAVNTSVELFEDLLKAAENPFGTKSLVGQESLFSPEFSEKFPIKKHKCENIEDKNEKGERKLSKVDKLKQPVRKNSSYFMSSLSSLWSLAGLGNNTVSEIENKANDDSLENLTLSKSTEYVEDCSQIRPKDSMLVFRKTTPGERDQGVLNLRETFLQKTVEDIATLDQECRQNMFAKTDKQQDQSYEFKNCVSSTELALNTISEAEESDNFNADDNAKNPKDDFKEVSKFTSKSAKYAVECNHHDLTNASNAQFVPAYTATILTTGTMEKPSLSMAQATSIIVKSARFSAKRREHYMPTTIRPPISQKERRYSDASIPLEKWSAKNIDIENNKSEGKDSLTKSNSNNAENELRNGTDNKVIAFSPLTSTAIEFPIINSQQPVFANLNDPEINELCNNNPIYDVSDCKKLPPARTARRKTLAKIAVGSVANESDLLQLKSGNSLPSLLSNASNLTPPTSPKNTVASLYRRRKSTSSMLSSESYRLSTKANVTSDIGSPSFISYTKTEKETNEQSSMFDKKEHPKNLLSPYHNVISEDDSKIRNPSKALPPTFSSISFIKSFFRRKSQQYNVSPEDSVDVIPEMDEASINPSELNKPSVTEDDHEKSDTLACNFESDKISKQNLSLNEISPLTLNYTENKSDLTTKSLTDEMNLTPKSTAALDSVSEHNSTVMSSTTSRNSDVSSSDMTPHFAWQTNGLPSIGGPKSNAWMNLTLANSPSDKGQLTRGYSSEKVEKRSLDTKIFVVWLERMEDMYHFPFDEMLSYTTDDGLSFNGTCSSARRFSTVNSPQSRSDFIIFYLCNIEPGLVQIQTEGVWTKKYGQPAPLVDGMIVPVTILGPLLQQTICSVARRKMVEVESYQLNHIKRRQAILEFSRNYAPKIPFSEFFEQFIV